MTYALLLIACMASNPMSCQEHIAPLPQITNATACHLVGQMETRRWQDAHKNQRLSDAYCIVIPQNKTVTAALEEFHQYNYNNE